MPREGERRHREHHQHHLPRIVAPVPQHIPHARFVRCARRRVKPMPVLPRHRRINIDLDERHDHIPDVKIFGLERIKWIHQRMPRWRGQQRALHLRPTDRAEHRGDHHHINHVRQQPFNAVGHHQRDLPARRHHPQHDAEIRRHHNHIRRDAPLHQVHMLRQPHEVNEKPGRDGRENSIVQQACDISQYAGEEAKPPRVAQFKKLPQRHRAGLPVAINDKSRNAN